MIKLAVFVATLLVSGHVHVTLWLLGSPMATVSVLQIAMAAFALFLGALLWITARSVLGKPYLPRRNWAAAR